VLWLEVHASAVEKAAGVGVDDLEVMDAVVHGIGADPTQ
jgi:predicted DNA repair protein MutK